MAADTPVVLSEVGSELSSARLGLGKMDQGMVKECGKGRWSLLRLVMGEQSEAWWERDNSSGYSDSKF